MFGAGFGRYGVSVPPLTAVSGNIKKFDKTGLHAIVGTKSTGKFKPETRDNERCFFRSASVHEPVANAGMDSK